MVSKRDAPNRDVRKWYSFDHEKTAGHHAVACHLLKQGLFCFNRLERQGDNRFENTVLVLGIDGSVVAFRR